MKVGDVEVHIEGSGPETVVMVHGWPDTYRLWEGQVAALKDRYRCVRFTVPGFDRAHERRARGLEEITGFIRQAVEQVSPGRPVILLLHDWGCVFGYQFYLRHPQLVSKIIGVDIGDADSLKRELTLPVALMILGYQLTLAFAWMMGGRVGDAIARFMARRMRCPSDPAPMSSAMTYPYYMTWFGGWRPQLRAFMPEVPMLYIYARRKPFMFHARSWLEYLNSRPGNAVVEFNTGHWVMQAAPARFNQVIGDWLSVTPK